jgi:hypothetical protein
VSNIAGSRKKVSLSQPVLLISATSTHFVTATAHHTLCRAVQGTWTRNRLGDDVRCRQPLQATVRAVPEHGPGKAARNAEVRCVLFASVFSRVLARFVDGLDNFLHVLMIQMHKKWWIHASTHSYNPIDFKLGSML